MSYSLSSASRFSKLSKSVLSRAIASGRLKATQLDDGSYEIADEEMGKFLATRKTEPGSGTERTGRGTPSEGTQIELLLQQVAHLETRLADKDDVIRGRDNVIDDLRARLDREEEERRVVTRQLTDMRERESQTSDVLRQVTLLAEQLEGERKRGWWAWLLGRR